VYNPRGWVEVTGSNVTLQGLYIPFNVDITSASNVTVKNDEIYGAGAQWGISLRHTKNVTIENDSIYGPAGCAAQMYEGVSDIYGDSTGTQIIGNDIWNTAGPVSVGNGLIEGITCTASLSAGRSTTTGSASTPAAPAWSLTTTRCWTRSTRPARSACSPISVRCGT
jgi:hypothetical protein